jgi:hypothetical protein
MIKQSDKEKKKVTQNISLLRRNDCPSRQDFIARYEEDTAFYFHQQFTAAEKDRKKQLKQLDIPIDRIRPIIRRTAAKIVKNRPTIAALTLDPSAKDLSRRVNAQVQYCMRISKGLSQIRRALVNTIRGGLSFIEQYIDIDGEIRIKYTNAKKVFVDPKAQDPLFDDADCIQIVEKVGVGEALRVFKDVPGAAERLTASLEESYQDEKIVDDSNAMGGITVGPTIEEVTEVEEVSTDDMGEEFSGWVELITTQKKIVIPKYFVKEEADNVIIEHPITKEEYKEGKKNGAKVLVKYFNRVREQIQTQSYMIQEQLLGNNVDEYTITPMIWEDTENPYSVGEVYFGRGNQRLQNAYYEVMLANAQAVSFPNVWFETSAFVDKDKALTKMSTPGGAIEFADGALSGGNPKALKTYAQPVNQAFMSLYQQLKQEQEHQASAPALQSGDPSQIPDTNKALINLDSFADRPLAINIDAIEACLERVFKNVIKMQADQYTSEKLLLIDSNPDNNVVINEAGINVNQDGSVTPVKIDNDISKIDYDIQLVPGSMSPLDRTTEYQYAMQAVQVLGATPEFAMRRMPITGIEDEIAKVDIVKGLLSKNQQLEEMVKNLSQEVTSLANKAQSATQNATDITYESKYKIELARIQDLVREFNRIVKDSNRTNEIIKKNAQRQITAQPKRAAGE